MASFFFKPFAFVETLCLLALQGFFTSCLLKCDLNFFNIRLHKLSGMLSPGTVLFDPIEIDRKESVVRERGDLLRMALHLTFCTVFHN